MKIIIVIFFVIFLSCKNDQSPNNADLLKNNSKSVTDISEKDIFNINEYYKELVKVLVELGYSEKSNLSVNKSKNSLFSYNGNVNAEGLKLKNHNLKNVWIDVVLYNYSTKEETDEVVNTILKSKILDIVFKDYNVIFRKENHLLLIKSGCNNTLKNWEEVKSTLDNLKLEKIIGCRCGGRCVK